MPINNKNWKPEYRTICDLILLNLASVGFGMIGCRGPTTRYGNYEQISKYRYQYVDKNSCDSTKYSSFMLKRGAISCSIIYVKQRTLHVLLRVVFQNNSLENWSYDARPEESQFAISLNHNTIPVQLIGLGKTFQTTDPNFSTYLNRHRLDVEILHPEARIVKTIDLSDMFNLSLRGGYCVCAKLTFTNSKGNPLYACGNCEFNLE